MRILFVRPPVPPHTIGLKHIMICEPLELEYSAAGLPARHEVQIMDLIIEKGFKKRLEKFQPDIVATSCYITGVNEVIKICRQTKLWNRNCTTIAGGVQASQVPEDFADPSIDCIVKGDGTTLMPEIAEALENGRSLRNIAGLAFPVGPGEVELTGGKAYMPNADDNIGVDWKYFEELMKALIPEKIIWMSQCSIHIADKPDMLQLAYASGCRLLSFGIESVNEKSIAWIEKDFNHPQHYKKSINTIRKHGIDVSTEMIIGMDGDDDSVFQKTFDFIMNNRISVPRVHILTPIPGTPLYGEMEREGRIINREFGRYSGGQVVFRPKNIKPDDLQKNYWKLYEALFTRTGIFKRTLGSPFALGSMMRVFVMGVNLHYRNHIRHRITPGIV